ncbi:MAG: class I SAM-dependent methyltransferase [Deltaproteobacteria bacterium]|nr:class I SAM-dependent methyltransferase [Deltaproteobacteria bacterium]
MEKDEFSIMFDIETSYWWFVGKQFLVKNILRKCSLNSLKKNRILDIGSGTGTILKLLEGYGIAYGVELSTDAIQFLKRRDLNFVVRSDASLSIPFKEDVFSVITCLDVLEHIDDDFALLNEMVRVCEPGGHIILTVPAFNALWSPHDSALQHRRRYTRKQMLKRVCRLNSAVIKSSYYNTALFLPILAVRKLKPFLSDKQNTESDLFIPIPRWLNALLTLLYMAEIACLQFLNFPFGVSLLLILKKSNGYSVDRR